MAHPNYLVTFSDILQTKRQVEVKQLVLTPTFFTVTNQFCFDFIDIVLKSIVKNVFCLKYSKQKTLKYQKRLQKMSMQPFKFWCKWNKCVQIEKKIPNTPRKLHTTLVDTQKSL